MKIDEIDNLEGINNSKENARKHIAYSITGAFVVFILITIIFTMFSNEADHFKNGKELISIIGSVFGFYFGSNET